MTTRALRLVTNPDMNLFAPRETQALRFPVPLMMTPITQETQDGERTDNVILWNNEDGKLCRACPWSRCTFRPGPEGQGICVVRSG